MLIYFNFIILVAFHKIINHSVVLIQTIFFFRKTYKAYSIEPFKKIVNNNDFGKSFTFSPINDLCKNDFEKSNAIYCLQKYPNASFCIYDYCIRNTVTYIGFNEFIIKKEFELPFAN